VIRDSRIHVTSQILGREIILEFNAMYNATELAARNACHARALSTSSQPWVHAGKRSLDSTVEALPGKLPSYRESFVATFDPICSVQRLGARRTPEGGNNLHVSRIIRGPEHARTKPERTHVGMRRRTRGLTCEHVNRPRPSCRS